MAIEDIFRALEEQADEECRMILEGAKAQAKGIEGEAREEAKRIRDRRVEVADASVRARAQHLLNAARLENRKATAAAKDDGVEGVFTDAGRQLAALRGTPEYERVFRFLAEEALRGVEGEVVVRVAPADAKLAATVLAEMGHKGEVEADLDTTGGLTVVSNNGTVIRRNTFEDRILKARPLVQSQISETLFA
jgi:vacuolar-type H+-ATPase subunit E/Vma4